jgi:4-amino-4-deoxy-L-arabinose transferase-like glycosyltransferase
MVAVLIGILGINIFAADWRLRLKLALIFVAVALMVVAPWLYVNYLHHGSPLYNTNYLNIATEFYPQLADGMTNQEGTRKLEPLFHSFGDVLR